MIALTVAITMPFGRSFFFSLAKEIILSQRDPLSHLLAHQRKYIRYCFIKVFYLFFTLFNAFLTSVSKRKI